MEFTHQDIDEIFPLADLLRKMDTIDAEYVHTISEDICKKQPFFLSVLLGYKPDLTVVELEELMKVYFLVWEWFKDKKGIETKRVTQELFEKIHDRNLYMLKYAEDEKEEDRAIIYGDDLQRIKSKSLLTTVHFRFNHQPDLFSMNNEIKGLILIGIKSFIECFEIIANEQS